MSKVTKKRHRCKLARAVKQELKERGYSHVWSERDFFWFKRWASDFEDDQVQRITSYFIQETADPSDYAQYTF